MGEGCCGGSSANGQVEANGNAMHSYPGGVDSLASFQSSAKNNGDVDVNVNMGISMNHMSAGEAAAGEALLASFSASSIARMVLADAHALDHHSAAKKAMKGVSECAVESGVEERLEKHTFLCSELAGPAACDVRLASAICSSVSMSLPGHTKTIVTKKGREAVEEAIKGLKENGCIATARWLRTVSRSAAFKGIFNDGDEEDENQHHENGSQNGDGKSVAEAAKAGTVTKKGKKRTFVQGDGKVMIDTGDAKSKQWYYEKRIELFEMYYARSTQGVEDAKEKNEMITITLPDGNTKEGVKGVTSAMDIALGISKGLASKALVCKVDGEVWDLTRPLEKSCGLELCMFDHEDGRETFWHSSAHLLGLSLELELGADLTIGPPLENGFYYDCFIGNNTLNEDDLKKLEKRMERAVKEKHPFQRATVSRDEALSMFQENKFKIELIEGLPEDASISIYKVGPMVDLCTGPHIPHAGIVKALWVTQASRSYWRADVNREHLMRIYGVTFPDKEQMKEHKHRIEEAKKRDHRTLGITHDLFFFHQLSPGSCFFTPHGARIYHNLMNLIRDKYWEYDYREVITPNIFNFNLWKTSGHADHYKANMFSFGIESEEFGMKPMNCPAHCLMFKERARSYRDLPVRLADFGVLHRNEFSGALHGLTRVRRFQQDDGHIFCRPDQVQAEVQGFLRFLDDVYTVFGLEYELNLSTRPDDYLGELDLWNQAESALENALNNFGKPWQLNPGDGAFYGPKIDVAVFDALKRKFQCATVQLDFQLPIRFSLRYACEAASDAKEEDRYARPVIVHRAVLGSVERMLAILTEHFACKWPLWLNPKQIMIIPVSEKFFTYASLVREKLHGKRFFVDADTSDRKLQKKIREAQLAQYNYILVVGKEEEESSMVNVRTRDNIVHGAMSIDTLVSILSEERLTRSRESSMAAESPNTNVSVIEEKMTNTKL